MTDAAPPAPVLTTGDLLEVIIRRARNSERSQQKEIGPSEVGMECSRRLALQLLGAPETNKDRDEWPATVGTAVHTWLEGAFKADNDQLTAAGQPARWL